MGRPPLPMAKKAGRHCTLWLHALPVDGKANQVLIK